MTSKHNLPTMAPKIKRRRLSDVGEAEVGSSSVEERACTNAEDAAKVGYVPAPAPLLVTAAYDAKKGSTLPSERSLEEGGMLEDTSISVLVTVENAAKECSIPPSLVKATEEEAPIQPKLTQIPLLLLAELQKENANNVYMALLRLYSLLTSKSYELNLKAFSMGAPSLLIRMLQKWQTNAEIQSWGCKCLGNVVISPIVQLAWADCHLAAIHAGGVEALVSALKLFPKDHHVQRNTAGCLAILLNNGKPKVVSDVTLRFVFEMGGLELLVHAMKEFPKDADIQHFCCALAYNLTLKKELHESIIKAGLPVAAATAMANHLYNKKIASTANRFMDNVCG